MEVTFTKQAGRRYLMAVTRERGPELAPRQGPGYDDYLPHDAVHFLVEREAHLAHAVFGQIAAGRSNLFRPADPALLRRQARRDKKVKPDARECAETARSEALASLCFPLWQQRAGLRSELPDWTARVDPRELVSPVLLERILARLGEFAAQWHPLPAGGSVTLVWQPLPERPARRPAVSRAGG